MKRIILFAAALCLMVSACSEGMDTDGVAEIPPVYELPKALPTHPQQTPELTPDPTDSEDQPHYGPVEPPQVFQNPDLQPTEDAPAQINPCLLHPEEC